MARFSKYICVKCGYEVKTEPEGRYCLMSGVYENFSCHKCKKIVSLCVADFRFLFSPECGEGDTHGDRRATAPEGQFPRCPECGSGELQRWNPVEGHCPKCNGLMEEKYGFVSFAD